MTQGKKRISTRLREPVARTFGNRCSYCLTPQRITGYRMRVDHIIPEAKGGRTIPENLCLACVPCNEHKGARWAARDPKTGRRVHLFNPRRQV